MNALDDKQLWLDMQEHPEKYSDEQLEQLMAELDKEPDAEVAWQLLSEKLKVKSEKSLSGDTSSNHFSLFTLRSSLHRIAAVFVAISFLGLMSLAGYRVFSDWQRTPKDSAEADTTTVVKQRFYYEVMDGDTIFRFENIRLDSILAVVSRHYNRQVVFHSKQPQHLRLYITCHTTQTLDEFVETMNMFDGFRIIQDFNTLHVESDEKKEGTR